MGTLLLYPSSEIPDDAPIEQIRLPWNIRRTLAGTGLKTVGNVRKSTNELLLRLGFRPRGSRLYPRNARLTGDRAQVGRSGKIKRIGRLS